MNETIDRLEKLNQITADKYEAFLYDCDGTLADNMAAHKLAYIEVSARHGVDLDPNMIDELAGVPTKLVANEITKRYGVEMPESFAREKSQIFTDKYIDQTTPIDYVVNHLKNHFGKVKIAVVSGGSRKTVTRTLTVLGLLPYIELLVCAGETEKGKPYADPFLKAAELLGVAPEKCIVFEDGVPGVQAAEAAGMDWVRVDQL